MAQGGGEDRPPQDWQAFMRQFIELQTQMMTTILKLCTGVGESSGQLSTSHPQFFLPLPACPEFQPSNENSYLDHHFKAHDVQCDEKKRALQLTNPSLNDVLAVTKTTAAANTILESPKEGIRHLDKVSELSSRYGRARSQRLDSSPKSDPSKRRFKRFQPKISRSRGSSKSDEGSRANSPNYCKSFPNCTIKLPRRNYRTTCNHWGELGPVKAVCCSKSKSAFWVDADSRRRSNRNGRPPDRDSPGPGIGREEYSICDYYRSHVFVCLVLAT